LPMDQNSAAFGCCLSRRQKEIENMKRSTLTRSVAACICLCVAGPLAAAQLPATGAVNAPPPAEANVSTAKPAAVCLSDLRTFDSQMEKDGYWPAGAGFGYGYPMDGYPAATATGYRNVRPSYELRTLIASADILAQHGQQQACEDMLSTIRGVYKTYLADMHGQGMPTVDGLSWQRQQIATAQPITIKTAPFRSDELLGTYVWNSKNETLGSVHDIVMSPKTGDIAYLVIGRGGFFGIDEKYVPVPWGDFKAAPNLSLLVLGTRMGAMDDEFGAPGQFDQESQKVDGYWKAHLANN
jgi:sporulation protein YlmC with PRC-barrel domain